MKITKFLTCALGLVLLVSACGPVIPTESPWEPLPATPIEQAATPAPTATLAPISDGYPAPALAAQAALAEELGVSIEQVKIVNVEAVEWRDSCLGAGGAAEICAQAITPGYRVELSVDETLYEYHTDEAKGVRRYVTDVSFGVPDQDALVIIGWHREGGIAGFCDDVTVYLAGNYTVTNCKGDSEILTGNLSESQMEHLLSLVDAYQPFEYTASDGAVADGLTISLTFQGGGSTEPDDAAKQAVGEFAAELATQARFAAKPDPDRDAAEASLNEFLAALNTGDYILGAKRYGGDTSQLETWNPDIKNDLPKWLERACTQNGLMCLPVRSVLYRGPDARGGYQFWVEFTAEDGTLFHQGPCCGDTSPGPFPSSFLFAVVKDGDNWLVMDLPPYVP